MELSEDRLQAEFFKWVWNTYPELRRKLWSVPNGGYRNKVEAMKLKATGMISGVWDLHLYYRGEFHIIESKVGRNKLSKEQEEWCRLMEGEGAKSHVYYTLEEGKAIISGILGY